MKMDLSLFFLIIFVFVIYISGSLGNCIPKGRIVGGHESEPHAHPYQVSLQMKILWLRSHMCGGAILNADWVLTAGHCFTESILVKVLPMVVVAGAHSVRGHESTVQRSNVARYVVHPQYKGGIGPNDLALAKLKHSLRFTEAVQPIALPYRDTEPEGRCTLSGWGLLKSARSKFPDRLQEIEMPIVPYDECHEAIDKLEEMARDKNPLDRRSNLCTGPLTGGISACSGDSGGALVQYSTLGNDTENKSDVDYVNICKTKESPVIIGVVSWGMDPCGTEGAPSVHTKVSSFIDFISDNID